MFRVIFLFISLIFFIIFDSKRWQIFFNSNYYKGTGRTGLSDFVRLTLRRRNAIKQGRKFFSKKNEFFKLKNNYVDLIYNYKNKSIRCIDKSIKKRITTVYWYEQTSNEINYIDNVFEEMFDNMCALFNEHSTYDGINTILKGQFLIEEIDNEGENDIANVNVPSKTLQAININSASEKELTDLPGISIIHAKNIIKYRTKKNGFKSIDEFYKVINLNSHFQNQLKYYLFVGSYTPPEFTRVEESLKEHNDFLVLDDSEYKRNTDRIIDL